MLYLKLKQRKTEISVTLFIINLVDNMEKKDGQPNGTQFADMLGNIAILNLNKVHEILYSTII